MAKNNVRIFVLVLILGYFQTCHCDNFVFGPTDDACILLNMDAVFELSKTVEGKTEVAPTFTVTGASVVRGRSICASDTSAPTITLSLFPTKESFKLNFQTIGSSREVELSFSLLLDPAQHFENSTGEQSLVLDSGEGLPAGEKNMSFKCDSVQTVLFNRDPTYKMTLTITSFKTQAYDVVSGNFSTEETCDADKNTPSTTLPTTTEMETTAPATTEESTTAASTPEETTTAASTPEETTSTQGPETTTQPSTEPTTKSTTATSPTTTNEPEPETTTTAQPSIETTMEPQTTAQTTNVPPTQKPTPKYNVDNGSVVCIVLQGTIRFDFTYNTTDGEDKTTSVQIPDNAKTEGNCSISTSTTNTQEIRLTFFKDTWTFTVEIAQDLEASLKTRHLLALEAENSYSWRKIQLDYVIDEEHFPNATNQGNTLTVVKEEEVGDFRASPQGSYQCNSGERLSLSEVVTLDLANFQYRAFGTTNETDFSGGEVSKCPADDGGDDDDDNDTLAIVLGSVFGGLGLIVIVIIVLHCARNRRKKHYETI